LSPQERLGADGVVTSLAWRSRGRARARRSPMPRSGSCARWRSSVTGGTGHRTSRQRLPRRPSSSSPSLPSAMVSPGRCCSPPPAGEAFRSASRCSDRVTVERSRRVRIVTGLPISGPADLGHRRPRRLQARREPTKDLSFAAALVRAWPCPIQQLLTEIPRDSSGNDGLPRSCWSHDGAEIPVLDWESGAFRAGHAGSIPVARSAGTSRSGRKVVDPILGRLTMRMSCRSSAPGRGRR
jgi:hypothetical protein